MIVSNKTSNGLFKFYCKCEVFSKITFISMTFQWLYFQQALHHLPVVFLGESTLKVELKKALSPL